MSPENFPLSSLVSNHLNSATNPPNRLTKVHLRLTAQSPATWHQSSAAAAVLKTSIHKLAYRARFEAELESAGIGQDNLRRVGKIPNSKDFSQYRERALIKMGKTVQEIPEIGFGALGTNAEEEWENALFLLQCFWSIRSWLEPVLETLLVLDRFSFLVENLSHRIETEPGGELQRKVQLINLFEQSTGSLRNLAIVVR